MLRYSQMNQPHVPRFAALRHRDFRLLWLGQLFSITGNQMQFIAVNWHVYQLLAGDSHALTFLGHSFQFDARALGLGVLGLVRVLPVMLFGLVGGVVADMHDRRRIILWTQTAAALCAAALAALTLSGNMSLPLLYLLTAAISSSSAFETPAQQALLPRLVPRAHFTNAVSLNQLLYQFAGIAGPALAGVLVGAFDIGIVYVLNTLSFLAVLPALLLMHYRGGPDTEGAASRPDLSLGSVVEGLRFVHGAPVIWGTMLLDFLATFFSSARTMLPLVADGLLGVGAAGYGVLSTAQAVGSLLAGAVLTWRGEIHRQGFVLLVSVAVYGLATALFGVSPFFVVSYVLFALTGAADTVSTVIRQTLRQVMTPDYLRGRMVGVNMIFFMGGPQLGELEAGLVAAALGVPFAIVSGGVATVLLTAWIAWKFPVLREYRSSEQPELVAT
jgi:MFS family permease